VLVDGAAADFGVSIRGGAGATADDGGSVTVDVCAVSERGGATADDGGAFVTSPCDGDDVRAARADVFAVS
jgi:hypothetical protein